MSLIYSPETPQNTTLSLNSIIGGKGKALFSLYNAGFPVPKPFCIGTGGYDLFVEKNKLREKINLELHRKDLKEMRWEEIWDISLRIQNLFIKGTFPQELYSELKEIIKQSFHNKPLVVRSSAPKEDGKSKSFAGLHDSYLNVSGMDDLQKKIKKVWASLWSDRSILYSQELGLETNNSSMAVVIQEFLEGESSGIVFSNNPLKQSELIIEAVYGLNQGLVDGVIEPDRWIVSRQSLQPQHHSQPEDRYYHFVRSPSTGVQRRETDISIRQIPPLEKAQVNFIADLSLKLEKYFHAPQDIEWTFADKKFYILQSRPITAVSGKEASDKRSWYLSLHRSYENLLQLWDNITRVMLPEMDEDSSRLADISLDKLSDNQLAEELTQRNSLNEKWTSVYWSDFIPFAHGVRLFGELYNDIMEPRNPFEFISLLTGQRMLSTERNATLFECAGMVQKDSNLRCALEKGKLDEIDNTEFQEKLLQLKLRFSMAEAGENSVVNEVISAIILQYAYLDTIPQGQPLQETGQLEKQFVQAGREKLPVDPEKLLEMARASYRIRDDDNIHIGRIAQELERAVTHARKRLQAHGLSAQHTLSVKELSQILLGKKEILLPLEEHDKPSAAKRHTRVKARQLQGQPASSGIAKGRARVISKAKELQHFQRGEILVIDAIDPTMTFFAPLSAGIIERRGGMLIHGAIIAREYGIPCVTGVAEATSYIHTGDMVTVDGYLGICTVQKVPSES